MKENASRFSESLKRTIGILLVLFIVGITNLAIRINKVNVGKFNESFHISFNSFIQELQDINDDISKVLISEEQLEKYIENNKKKDETIRDFYVLIGQLEYFNRKYDRNYLERLWCARENLYEYISDKNINAEEKEYMNLLLSYNQELLKEYRIILEKNNLTYDFTTLGIKRKKIKHIEKIYMEFQEKANIIIDENKYKILEKTTTQTNLDIQNDISVEEAKNICQEVVKKVLPDEGELLYEADKQRDTREYVFNSFSFSDIVKQNKSPYKVYYDKKENSVNILLHCYSPGTIKTGESILDNKSEEVVEKLGITNYKNYSRNVYYKDKKLDRIEYKYINFIDGVYNETEFVELEVFNDGKLHELKIRKPLENNTFSKPKLSRDEIMGKIKNGDIKECILINTFKNQFEYEVHVDINGVNYGAVFDGNTGEEKYITRDIREYNKEI